MTIILILCISHVPQAGEGREGPGILPVKVGKDHKAVYHVFATSHCLNSL
jgi:hypothetical protein